MTFGIPNPLTFASDTRATGRKKSGIDRLAKALYRYVRCRIQERRPAQSHHHCQSQRIIEIRDEYGWILERDHFDPNAEPVRAADEVSTVLKQTMRDSRPEISPHRLSPPHLHRLLRTIPSTPLAFRYYSSTSLDTVPLAFHHVPAEGADVKKDQSLVICHGLFGSKQNWRTLSKALAQKLRMQVFVLVSRYPHRKHVGGYGKAYPRWV